MLRTPRPTVALAFLVATSLLSTPASAEINKCHTSLVKAGTKLHNTAKKTIDKVLASVRSKGATEGVADTADALFGKLYTSSVNKTVEAIAALFVSGDEVCTTEDLRQLGHLQSAVNAPGTNPQDFLTAAIVLKEIANAVDEAMGRVGDGQDLLARLIRLSNCTPPNDVTTNADCTGAGTPASCCTASGEGTCRPYLCSFGASENPDCRAVTCELSASSAASINANGAVGIPFSISGDDKILEACQAPAILAAALPIDAANAIRVVSGGASRTIEASVSGAGTLCLNEVRSEGWCDCVAGGDSGPINTTTCQDHIANNTATANAQCVAAGDPYVCCTGAATGTCDQVDGCGEPVGTETEDCICQNGTDCQSAGCAGLDCVDATLRDGTRCHSGTVNGPVTTSFSGSSTAGDCMVSTTFSASIVSTNGVCRATGGASAGATLGLCGVPCGTGATPCAADATCNTLLTAYSSTGGCYDPRGADSTNCTRDDLVPPVLTTTIPLTTGSASAVITDLVQVEGVCVGGDNVGTNCISGADCQSGVCGGALAIDPNSTVTAGPGVGLGGSCAKLDAGTLTALRLVAAVPGLDALGSNDGQMSLSMVCR